MLRSGCGGADPEQRKGFVADHRALADALSKLERSARGVFGQKAKEYEAHGRAALELLGQLRALHGCMREVRKSPQNTDTRELNRQIDVVKALREYQPLDVAEATALSLQRELKKAIRDKGAAALGRDKKHLDNVKDILSRTNAAIGQAARDERRTLENELHSSRQLVANAAQGADRDAASRDMELEQIRRDMAEVKQQLGLAPSASADDVHSALQRLARREA